MGFRDSLKVVTKGEIPQIKNAKFSRVDSISLVNRPKGQEKIASNINILQGVTSCSISVEGLNKDIKEIYYGMFVRDTGKYVTCFMIDKNGDVIVISEIGEGNKDEELPKYIAEGQSVLAQVEKLKSIPAFKNNETEAYIKMAYKEISKMQQEYLAFLENKKSLGLENVDRKRYSEKLQKFYTLCENFKKSFDKNRPLTEEEKEIIADVCIQGQAFGKKEVVSQEVDVGPNL